MVNVKKMLTKTLMIFRVKDQLISLSSRINSIILEEGILIRRPKSRKIEKIDSIFSKLANSNAIRLSLFRLCTAKPCLVVAR